MKKDHVFTPVPINNKYQVTTEKKADIAYVKSLFNGQIFSNCIPSMLIFGEPGAGKTSFGKYLAEELNAKFIFAPCYDGVGAEQLVYNWDLGTLVDAMTDEHTKGRDAMKDGYLLQTLKISQKEKVILLIDEVDKAKPSVDTFLLSFLQECMLNDPITGLVKGKKENIFIIFTSNKRRELEDALDRRFTLIREFKFPNKQDLYEQVKGMMSVNYNDTKLRFLLDVALFYRSIPDVTKKPSQNQLADLAQELYALGNLSGVGRRNVHKMKTYAMLWKFSQNTNDHDLFMNHARQKVKVKAKNLEVYLGSMI
jgi:MoxR-like ATPase